MKKSLLYVLVLIVSVCGLPTVVCAQADHTMEFGVDDVDESDKSSDEDQSNEIKKSDVIAAVLPTEALSSRQQRTLQTELESLLQELKPDLRLQKEKAFLSELETQGGVSCTRESVCLSTVARSVGAGQVILLRVEKKQDGAWNYNLDRFDVSQKLFTAYDERSGLGALEDVKVELDASVRNIFDLEVERKRGKPIEGDSGTNVQQIFAYTAGGLALASLGAGIFFGLKVKNEEDALRSGKSNGQFTYTQKEADRRVRDIESLATTANIFYGVSAGLAITSAVLFIVESGSDVAEEGEQSPRAQTEELRIAPYTSSRGFGFGLHLSF